MLLSYYYSQDSKGIFFAHSIINYALYALLIALLWDLTLHSVKTINGRNHLRSHKRNCTLPRSSCRSLLWLHWNNRNKKTNGKKTIMKFDIMKAADLQERDILKYYDLHHSAVFGIYTKKLQRNTSSSFDTTNICPLNYKKHGVIF